MNDIFEPALGRCPVDCVTMVVSMDEPCVGLYEVDIQSPGNRGFHRYQVIKVMRNDKVAEAWVDLGLSSEWPHDIVRIPGGVRDNKGVFHIVHTVGELIDIANEVRLRPSFDKVDLVCSKSGAERIKT